jgi:uncharacterized cupredoxin-like copper-binding protein
MFSSSRTRSLTVLAFALLALSGCGSQTPSFTAASPSLPSASAPGASPSTAASATAAPFVTPSPSPSPSLGFVPGTKDNPRPVAMTADDQLTFFPNVVTAAQGETVKFSIKNVGKAEHEFMLGPAPAAFADKEGTPEVAGIGAGQTKSLTFTFTGSGPYAFACHEPGHFEAGMLGYVIVVGPNTAAVGTAKNPRLVEVAMTDQLKFVPDQIAVTQGETVTFLITNEGTAVHEFAVGPADKVDADEVDGKLVLEADEIDGHHLKTVTYTFAGPGPYGFACHEPGHFESGMRGSITLK